MNKDIKILDSDLPRRGNFIVASIKDTSRIESAAISYFRLWYNGDASRKRIERNLTISHGYMKGYKLSKAIHDFCTLAFYEGVESFSIQPVKDEFITADENCLSKLVFYNVLGKDEDSRNIAKMLVPVTAVSKLVFLAKDLNFLHKGI